MAWAYACSLKYFVSALVPAIISSGRGEIRSTWSSVLGDLSRGVRDDVLQPGRLTVGLVGAVLRGGVEQPVDPAPIGTAAEAVPERRTHVRGADRGHRIDPWSVAAVWGTYPPDAQMPDAPMRAGSTSSTVVR
ncbi:hypothetical protein GCM10028775_78740 [Catellatospora paridis]